MTYFWQLRWWFWHRWNNSFKKRDIYITFSKSYSADVKFYRVYCQIYPLEVTYDTLHFEVYPTQVDPENNTMLKVKLNTYLLSSFRYNIGVSSVDTIGNESDLVKLNNVTL